MLKWFRDELSSRIVSYIFVKYVLPLCAPMTAVILGIIENAPLLQTFGWACLAFGGAATGLVMFDNWREKKRVEDKLVFGKILAGLDSRGSKGIAIGFTLNSLASVPIEWELKEMRTSINNRLPSKSDYEVTKLVTPPHGFGYFNDHVIDIGKSPKKGSLEGKLEARVLYGRKGSLVYELKLKFGVVLMFDENGVFTTYTSHQLA